MDGYLSTIYLHIQQLSMPGCYMFPVTNLLWWDPATNLSDIS